MFNMFLSAAENCGEGLNILPIVVIVILFLFLAISPIFTGRKRSKEAEKIHNSLQPGDVIETVGGLIGTILEIRTMPNGKDKQMVIETGVGDNKTTMVFDIKAFMAVITPATPAVEASAQPTESTDSIETTEQSVAEEKPADEFVPPVVENIIDTQPEAPAQVSEPTEESVPVEEQAAATQPTEEEKPVEEPVAEEKSDYVAEPEAPEIKPVAEEASAEASEPKEPARPATAKQKSAPKASNAPKSSGTAKKKSTSSKSSTKK